jgi:ABC-type oligopeptide transport system substrate-binding subunit
MMDEWRHDASLKLKKNPRYFDPNLPKAERIEMRIGWRRHASVDAL